MIGGLFKSASRLALVAVAGVMVGGVSAKAADLGGDCCADLEERVAELEATTARKGNRKVSLTVSGWVNEGLLIWNDGKEKNAYVGSNNYNRSRFRFTGDAKISPDWAAGFLMEFGVVSGSRLDGVNRLADDNVNANVGVDVRHVAWWLENKQYGRVWVGQTSNATAGLNGINLSQVADNATNGQNNIGGGFQLRAKNGPGGADFATAGVTPGSFTSAVTLGGLRFPLSSNGAVGFGEKFNVIKYVSPTIMGFIFSASWGEDDMWDVALRYAGEFSGFKLAAGVGFMQWTDGNPSAFSPVGANAAAGTAGGSVGPAAAGPRGDYGCAAADLMGSAAGAGGRFAVDSGQNKRNGDVNCSSVQVGASIMHVATGLYAAGSFGQLTDKNRADLFNHAVDGGVDSRDWVYQIQAGIEQKWFAIGKTTVYGEYLQTHTGANITSANMRVVLAGDAINSLGVDSIITGANTSTWGVGIFQGIDAAAMQVYAMYRSTSAEVNLQGVAVGATNSGKSNTIADQSYVMLGGIINF